MCKMAHFGNCDPETADQEYCIFHKPNKSEEEAVEFYRKFLERFRPRVEEIEVEGEKIKRLVFEEPVDARGFVFPESPWPLSTPSVFYMLENSPLLLLFLESSMFYYAIFKENADFRLASFSDDINFSNSSFEKNALFRGSKFGIAQFYNAKFWGLTDMSYSVFTDIANFEKTVFLGYVDFSSVLFEQDVSFKNARFKSNANFNGCSFRGFTIFSEVIFDKETLFMFSSFEDSNFQHSEFKNKVFFDGSIFNRLPAFVDTKDVLQEPTPKFHNKLSFANCDFRQGADFLGSLKNETNISKLWKFFESRFSNPQSMIEALRVQRLSFEKEGKRDEADRMFVLEMRAKRRVRAQEAKNKLERIKAKAYNFIEWILADLPSEYGTNWVRLFLMSLLVIIGNTVPYTIWSHQINGFPETSNFMVRFANALYYSLVTFTTLGYGDMHPTGWLKALSGLEALTGAVFMALIVAVIARKWMR